MINGDYMVGTCDTGLSTAAKAAIGASTFTDTTYSSAFGLCFGGCQLSLSGSLALPKI